MRSRRRSSRPRVRCSRPSPSSWARSATPCSTSPRFRDGRPSPGCSSPVGAPVCAAWSRSCGPRFASPSSTCHRWRASTSRGSTSIPSRPPASSRCWPLPSGWHFPSPIPSVKKFNLVPPEVIQRAFERRVARKTFVGAGVVVLLLVAASAGRFLQVHSAQNGVEQPQDHRRRAQCPDPDLRQGRGHHQRAPHGQGPGHRDSAQQRSTGRQWWPSSAADPRGLEP